MKRLCLLRHAEALPAVAGVMDDKGRVLSAQGKKEAIAAGVFLRDKYGRPDYALCSTSQRTRQTLDGVMQATGAFRIDYTDALYNAEESPDFLTLIRAVPDAVKMLLIVSHNPDIQKFSGALTDDVRAFSPATMALIACEVESWSALRRGGGRIEAFFHP